MNRRAGSRIALILTIGALCVLPIAFAQPNCRDMDGDGYFGTAGCGSLDCNDADPHVFPGAVEACNGWDDNCDGRTDEGCPGICTTPEKRFGEKRIEGSEGASQYQPTVIRIPNGYAVAWNQAVPEQGYECDEEVRVVRIDENGTLRFGATRVGAPGSPGRATRDAELGWSGTEFVVGVGDVPIADCTTPGPLRAYFQLLDRVLNPIGEPVDVSCHAFATSVPIGIVWTGAHWILIWGEGFNYLESLNGYYATRMSAEGDVVDPCGVQLLSGTRTSLAEVASNGEHFLIAWPEVPPEGPQFNSEVYIERFDFDLAPIDAEPRRITTNDELSYEVSVAWADDEWALAWSQDYVDGYHEIAFARLDADANLIEPPGIVQVTTGAHQPGGFNKGLPEVRWTGQEYGVFYLVNNNLTEGSGDLRLARLTADGTHLLPDALITTDSQRDAYFYAPVWNGEDYGVAWQDRTLSGGVPVKFGRMGCRCGDLDGDGFTSCAGNDCDDGRNDVNPLRPEICGDAADNDCDTLTDCNDVTACPLLGPPPEDVSGLTANSDKVNWAWSPTPGADRYDAVRGLLSELRFEGDARYAECVGSDLVTTGFVDGEESVRDDGFYYLVRSQSGLAASCMTGPWGSAYDEVIRACP